MTMSEIMQPKWWLDTKRGIGMAMAAAGTIVPLLAGYMGVTIDAATVGQLAAEIAKWFDVTWNVIAYGLMIYGMWRPSAPLSLTKPV
jgi:hypothetical protein